MLSFLDAAIHPNNRFLTPGEIRPVPREERLSRSREGINRVIRAAAPPAERTCGPTWLVDLPMPLFPADLRDDLTTELEAAGWDVCGGLGIVRIAPRRS